MLIKFSMVSPLGVVGKFTAEIAEFAEVFLEFSAVLAGSAVHIHFGLFDNTWQGDYQILKFQQNTVSF